MVAAETNEGGKLFKGGNYSRKYGITFLMKFNYHFLWYIWVRPSRLQEKNTADSGGSCSTDLA